MQFIVRWKYVGFKRFVFLHLLTGNTFMCLHLPEKWKIIRKSIRIMFIVSFFVKFLRSVVERLHSEGDNQKTYTFQLFCHILLFSWKLRLHGVCLFFTISRRQTVRAIMLFVDFLHTFGKYWWEISRL